MDLEHPLFQSFDKNDKKNVRSNEQTHKSLSLRFQTSKVVKGRLPGEPPSETCE